MEVDLVDDDSVILVTGEEHRLEGNDHYKKSNYKAALECYTAAIDTEPDVALFYSNRSAANLMLNRYEDALNDAKKACELDDANVKALIRLCKCQMIMGNTEAAKKVLERVIRIDSKNKDTIEQMHDLSKYKENYEQYQSQYQKGDLRHALHCIENCLKIAHASVELKLIRVELFIYLKRYIEAKDILEKQLIDDKHGDNQLNTEALLYRGLCFYYMEHMDKAQTHFQHVLRLNPDHKKAQAAYKRCKKLGQLKAEGNTLVRAGQFEEARRLYGEALDVDPDHDSMNAKLLANRSLTLQKLSLWTEALVDCDRALILDPGYGRAATRRVQALMGLERWDEALQAATAISRSQGGDPEIGRLIKEAQVGLKRSKQVDLYKVLGVPKTATEAELKQGYRRRALVHHPDRHSHADEATRKAEEQKFKEVNTAYSVLSDQRKRQMYDGGADVDEVLGNGGSGGGGGFHGGDPYEVFHAFFNSGGGGGGQKFHFQFQ